MEYCFYLDWRGLTSSEWAAWVQAVGSVLAIFAAAWLPMWHRKRELRARLAGYVSLVKTAHGYAKEDYRNTQAMVGGLADPSWNHGRWDLLIATLRGVDYQHLPDFGLFAPLQDALIDSERCRSVLIEAAEKGRTQFPVTQVMANETRAAADRLAASYRQAVFVLDRYGGRTLGEMLHRPVWSFWQTRKGPR